LEYPRLYVLSVQLQVFNGRIYDSGHTLEGIFGKSLSRSTGV
jgi:hypothetical protein